MKALVHVGTEIVVTFHILLLRHVWVDETGIFSWIIVVALQ